MDKEITRLLKLSSIPGFRLTKKETELLESWKAEQEEIKPKRIYTKQKTTRKKKTTNEVKETEKETGKIEIENITPEAETINVETFWTES